MSHRLVSAASWTDPRVRAASLSARAVLAWLMGGPARTSLPGLVPIGPAGLAERMPCSPSEARRALGELEQAGLIEVDAECPMIRIVDAIHWEPASPPKVIQSWHRLDLPARPIVQRHVLAIENRLERNPQEGKTDGLDALRAVLGHILNAQPDSLSEGLSGTPPDTLSGSLRARAPAASSSSSSSPSSLGSGSGTQRGWRRVPESWNPNDVHKELAAQLGIDLEPELAKFRDHEFAKLKSDADRTFSNWLRQAAEYRSRGNLRGAQKQPNHGRTGFETLEGGT